jgi:hypothetical protein
VPDNEVGAIHATSGVDPVENSIRDSLGSGSQNFAPVLNDSVQFDIRRFRRTRRPACGSRPRCEQACHPVSHSNAAFVFPRGGRIGVNIRIQAVPSNQRLGFGLPNSRCDSGSDARAARRSHLVNGGDPISPCTQNRNLAWNSIWRGSYVVLFIVPKLLLLKLPGTTPVAALGVTFTPPTDKEKALAIGSV